MATKTYLTKGVWNTYRTTGYTHDVGNDQRSAGGVHHHQVRLTKAGWQYRIVQSNGNHRSIGKTEPLSREDGESRFETACSL